MRLINKIMEVIFVKYKIAFIGLFLICFTMVFPECVSAKESNCILDLPTEITAFVNENVDEFADGLIEGGIISKTEEEEFCLGKPYVIYNSYNNQEGIYYFPIIMRNKVIAVVSVLDTEEGLEYQIGEDISEQLNEIGYINSDFILYEYNNFIYAENNKERKYLYSYTSQKEKLSDKQKKMEKKFYNSSFKKKVAMVNGKVKKFNKYVEKRNSIDGEDFDTIIKGSLSLYKPMGQYGYGMCWASSVATVVNYKKTCAITPFEICNKMGIGYNNGGTIYNEQDALSMYGVKYSKIRNYLS